MSFFGKILDKLGFRRDSGQAAQPTPTAGVGGQTAAPSQQPQSQPVPGHSGAPAPAPISTVDVAAQLEGMAATHPEKLNWKTSIVDLLKLLGLDSSLNARKELATELGCPAGLMGDSAQMNMWLHKAVLRKLAENGGKVPKDLLD
jgi:hypothetical protein